MNTWNPTSILRLAVLAVALLALPTAALAATTSPSNKWRVEFSGGADSDGAIVIKVTPKGGESIEASIDVKKGTGENAVAKTVVKGLKAQLPKEAYHVERDDGEDVLVKKKRGAADFSLEIVSNTVKGVRIHPEHE
ncbi:MAG: hypothetical protein R3233_10405 [Xanthomonadales bacterium]|nr:hypothetical protein [Xanthomonadales bacterium]